MKDCASCNADYRKYQTRFVSNSLQARSWLSIYMGEELLKILDKEMFCPKKVSKTCSSRQ